MKVYYSRPPSSVLSTKMSEAKGKKGPSSEVCGNCLEPEGSAKVSKLSACARCGLVLYCSRDCQRAHWKANHKQRCVAKADRVPQQQDTSGARIGDNASSNTAATGEKCSICLDPLADSSATTLQCTHMFHAACLAELRLLGIKQACPLCRTPLLQEGGGGAAQRGSCRALCAAFSTGKTRQSNLVYASC